MEWTKKQPIFATSDKKIVRVMSGRIDAGETSQMDQRWTYIELKYSYQKEQINYDLIPCCIRITLFAGIKFRGFRGFRKNREIKSRRKICNWVSAKLNLQEII